ncbi:ribonuclease T2-like isoform X2 [Juglans microcarpa x Juglans regia]|uniref:ribonuclease T2-like isoform X2 n=1 Tax=Juglans microcarpa x Juglans regia TaxID=2249226 RepID=UPI001B7E2E9E|nr:ribonuclease T2-like isoform X2 [Juglans microcarpa x Juglans regia]
MVALTTKVMSVSCLVLAIGIYIYPRDHDHSFDYFYLALQWPASVCHEGSNVNCINPLPGNFTIHGLWAQKKIKNHNKLKSYDCNSTSTRKKICRKHPFNYDELKNDKMLMEMMNKSWPNLIEGRSSSPDHEQNKKFWKQEWERHGCCLFNFKSKQKEYFKKTCGMWKQAPLLEIFAAHTFFQGMTRNFTVIAKWSFSPWRAMWFGIVLVREESGFCC